MNHRQSNRIGDRSVHNDGLEGGTEKKQRKGPEATAPRPKRHGSQFISWRRAAASWFVRKADIDTPADAPYGSDLRDLHAPTASAGNDCPDRKCPNHHESRGHDSQGNLRPAIEIHRG